MIPTLHSTRAKTWCKYLQTEDALIALIGIPQILAMRVVLMLLAQIDVDLSVLALWFLNDVMSKPALQKSPMFHERCILGAHERKGGEIYSEEYNRHAKFELETLKQRQHR
mmetsp:Transcript_50733/g.131914  ORF Transcript_50733/g.131914 Transcript_50733/m.131914 type:complete len:111 (-) Transcript_50733:57-389(-)